MSRTLNIIATITLVILALAIVGGLTWANTHYASLHPGEKDFFVPWLAAGTLLQFGNSPYSEPAAQRAQVIYYGHLATQEEDPLRLSVPFPLELFYFPFALISDYALARGLWMTCLEIALIALAFVSLRLTGWKPSRSLMPVFLVFSIIWIYALLPLTGGSAVIFSSLAIMALLLAIRDGRDEMAGALLVFPFLQLDLSILLVIFILWWAVYNHRGRLVAGFLMTITILLAVSFFILPNWFFPYVAGVISHFHFLQSLSPMGIFSSWWTVVGPRLAWLLTGLLLIIIFIEWRNVRHKDFRHFLWTSCCILAITPLIGIPAVPQSYELLFLPLVLFLSILAERWSRPGRWGVAAFGLIAVLLGFWGITAGLFLSGSYIALSQVLALLFPTLLVIGLYWMRWWAVRPPRTWSDSLP
jgi:hypothetical protein